MKKKYKMFNKRGTCRRRFPVNYARSGDTDAISFIRCYSKRDLKGTRIGEYMLRKEAELERRCIRILCNTEALYGKYREKGTEDDVIVTLAYWEKGLRWFLPADFGGGA